MCREYHCRLVIILVEIYKPLKSGFVGKEVKVYKQKFGATEVEVLRGITPLVVGRRHVGIVRYIKRIVIVPYVKF